MKTWIYFTGILGSVLLVFRLIGIFTGFARNDWLLVAGVALLGLVYMPLIIIDRNRHDQKIDQIIKAHKEKNEKNKTAQKKKNTSPPKAWDMNTSPFRERKSGLTWGGGNIKAANATREKRRSFLK